MSKNKNIRPHNNKGQRHGLWKIYSCSGGELIYIGFYHNNKEVGYEETYSYLSEILKKKYHI